MPFTLIAKPSPAQAGRRTASVNGVTEPLVMTMEAVSPSGKLESIFSVTPDLSVAVDGTNRLTHTVSPVALS